MGVAARVMDFLLLLGMIIAAFYPSLVKAEPKTIRVPMDYLTIKQAVEAASVGDTIIVSGGTYAEGEIWVTKPGLSLIANGTVVVDGLKKGWVFYVIADNVTIKGFTVKNSRVGWPYSGICLDHVLGCIVKNNTAKNNGDGIFLFASRNNTILGNTVSYNDGDSIILEYSHRNIVINNTAMNNELNGIYLGVSDDNLLVRNHASNNKYNGIEVSGSNNNTLSNNTASHNNYHGIKLAGHSGGTVMSGNSMIGNRYNLAVGGEYLSDFMNVIDSSNLVNGKRVIYLVNQNNLTIDPYTSPNTGYIGIVNSTRVTVKNISLTDNGEGVLFAYTTNSTIEDVNVARNYDGIYLCESSGNIISRSTATRNWYGIRLFYSDGNTVSANVLTNNGVGIDLSVSDKNLVLDNLISNSRSAGIEVSADNNTISGNTLAYNGAEIPFLGGILLYGSYNNLTGNTLIRNTAGMWVLTIDGNGNSIYHNNFINNTAQLYNVGGSVNTWDNGYPSGGNYWSDYNGTDLHSGPYQNVTGSDGIGDTPYIIDASNQDRFPLMKPIETHDLAVVNIMPSATEIYASWTVYVNVTVKNNGNFTETFNVSLWCSSLSYSIIIGNQTVKNLEPRGNVTLTFSWDTANLEPCMNYSVWVEASAVPHEINIENNVYVYGFVKIKMLGDINGDRKVDIYDVVTACSAYGSREGDPNWNPFADLAPPWGIISIYDMVTITYHFGKTCP